ncbi:hypothetical protein [Streptomyces sp. Act143]|uniref:hypothetical protein n=1 Tax=Streptomyces sp. Act143 TaxID=2200760 RepID=UPI00215A91E1|nr:hypothetical protein [Streptomyces sp. Act143]
MAVPSYVTITPRIGVQTGVHGSSDDDARRGQATADTWMFPPADGWTFDQV